MEAMQTVLRVFGHSLGLPSQYKFVKKIGKGTEGDVWLCTDTVRNCMVAVKLIPRGPPLWRLNMVGREGRMLTRLGVGHINIVRPLEIVLTSRHLAFVQEYVPGGSMSDYLYKHKMDEDVARYFFKQLLAALCFCHQQQVVYRDIKPANALITSTNPPFLKLCDFGLANNWSGREGPLFDTLAGTPGYLAPEIMLNFIHPTESKTSATPYDGIKADVYSAGVMLVVMLLHTMPWHYDTYAARLPPVEAMKQLWQLQVVQGVAWSEATSKVTKLSQPLSALLDTMLEPNVDKRATLEQVLASEWVNLPLPPKLQAATEVLTEQQQETQEAAARAAAGGAISSSGLSEEEVQQRLAEFEKMMATAETVNKGFTLEQRLLLTLPTRSARLQQQQQQQQKPLDLLEDGLAPETARQVLEVGGDTEQTPDDVQLLAAGSTAPPPVPQGAAAAATQPSMGAAAAAAQ